MGLASKIKQQSAAGNPAAQYAQGQSGPPNPYGTAAPPPSSQYYAQQHDGYGGGNLTSQSPSAPPLPYGAPSQYYGQKSDGYGSAGVSSDPYPYPSSRQEQSYTQASPYSGTSRLPSEDPFPQAGFDKQQISASSPYSAYPSYPYPQQHSHAAGSYEGQSNYTSGAPYEQAPSYASHSSFPPSNNADVVANKLQYIVQSHGLQRFYDASRFQVVLQKLAAIDFGKIAAEWRIGKELAYDLAPLALYDIIFYCDDSGSMAFEENGERINDLRFILSKVSGIATMFDDDGIRVRFMNSNVSGDGICSAANVEYLMSQVKFSGATPLGTNLDKKVLQPFVLDQARGSTSSMAKPVLVIIITDGEPYGESRDMIVQVIRRAKDALARTPYGSGALAIQIAQVGKDAKTQKFLEALDKDPVVGGMIDCTSYYEMEEEEFARKGVTLTPELWLLKMCVGAIDPDYDSKDD